VRKQRSYKALRRKRTCPATRRGLMPTTWSGGFPVGSPHRGPPTILTQSLSFSLFSLWVGWWFGAPVGSRRHPWVSPRGGYQGSAPRNPPGPTGPGGRHEVKTHPEPRPGRGCPRAPAPRWPGEPRRV